LEGGGEIIVIGIVPYPTGVAKPQQIGLADAYSNISFGSLAAVLVYIIESHLTKNELLILSSLQKQKRNNTIHNFGSLPSFNRAIANTSPLFTSSSTSYYSHSTMKIIALTLAAAVAATFPLATVAKSNYNCRIDADYKVDDSASKPHYPSSAEKDWASSSIKDAYEAVHDKDWDMGSVSWSGFSMNPDRAEVEKVERLSLRGAAAEETLGLRRRSWMVYDARIYNDAGIYCNLCGNEDDDDAMSSVAGEDTAKGGVAMAVSMEEQALINENFGASKQHKRWVETWCDKLHQGPYEVFKWVYDCSLTIHDCTSMVEGVEEGVKDSGKIMVDIN
jgi:hypothetical protein